MRRAVILGLLLAATPAVARGQAASAAERRAVDRAERLDETGQADEAVRALEAFLDEHPAGVEALGLLYRLLSATEGVDRMLPRIDAAVTRDPAEPAIRQLQVRALVRTGRVDSALAVADAWARERPAEPRAALSLAEAASAAGDSARALEVLSSAETRAADPHDLRVARADLGLAVGDETSVVAAWTGLLSSDPPDVDAVAEDLEAAGEERARLLGRLAGGLQPGPAAAAGALVALRAGGAGVARALADGAAVPDFPAFLRDYAREADRVGLAGEVAWAANELVRLSPRPIDRLRWRALAADRALLAGDSATARRAFTRLAEETAPGDSPHEAASRRLVELLAARPDDLPEAERVLARYAAAYPDSARARAAMAGELALGYARAGDLARAEGRLAEGRAGAAVTDLGPLESTAARIAWYAGRADSAIARLERTLSDPALSPDDRTDALRVATVLERADSVEVEISGRLAFSLLRAPATVDAASAIQELAAHPPGEGRPAVLAYLAGLAAGADRGDLAAALRRRVVDAFPASPEAPAALLELARAAPEAERRTWLERLIVGYPESALAPVARRLLAELGEGRASG